MEVESEDWLAPRLRWVVSDSTLVLMDIGMTRLLRGAGSQMQAPGMCIDLFQGRNRLNNSAVRAQFEGRARTHAA
jgi:hypothetical protein